MSRIRSNFSPSRPLQLWFEAACGTSLARDKYTVQSTQKSRRGRYSFILRLVYERCAISYKLFHRRQDYLL
jgi:hypothetical protein